MAVKGDSSLFDDPPWNGGFRGFWIYLSVASLIAIILSLGFLARGKAFAFYDFGSDTFACFYPLQVAIARQLQTLHSVTWSFELGLGAFAGSLFDPLWLVTGWMPASWQLGLRLPMFLLRLLAGGGFFYGYLRQVGLCKPVSVIGGLGYAFSTYGIVNTQWEVMQGAEYVQFSAYLFLLERYLKTRKISTGMAAGIVVGIGHPFGLYMFALFTFVYGAVRIATFDRAHRMPVALTLLKFAACCLIGLALTAPLLLPEIYYLLDSPRVSGNHASHLFPGSLLSLNDWTTIGSEVTGLLGKDLIGTGTHYVGWQNYFEGPGFYVGLLPLLCLPQLLGPCATRRERILCIVAMFGCILYFVWPALRYAVYGFGHQAFRFSTLWISTMLLVLGLAGIQRALLSGWWRPGLAFGAGVILIIALAAMVTVPDAVNVGYVTRIFAFTLLYTGLALLITNRLDQRISAAYLLVAICACELTMFATPAIFERDAVGIDGSKPNGHYDDSSIQALEFIRHYDHSDNFFRIEKTYASVFLDDALVQGYPGTASYYFHASGLTRFVDRMELPRYVPHPNYISSMAPRAEVLSLLGVKYVLAHDRSLDGTAAMRFIARTGDVDIYRNETAHEFATFYDAIESESQADASPVPERDALLLSTAIVEEPTAIEANLRALQDNAPAPDSNGHAAANVRRLRDDKLDGEVATSVASLLLLAMPFDRGWSATLDGRNLDLFRADYGLTATLISAGRHTISLNYVPPGRQFGFSLMAGVVTFIVVFVFFPGGGGRPSEILIRLRRFNAVLRGKSGASTMPEKSTPLP